MTGCESSALTFAHCRSNQSSKQLIKWAALKFPTMGWIAALVTIPALAMLGVTLWRLGGDRGWRDQAEGLRERLEHELD
jgi:hypothetical protein